TTSTAPASTPTTTRACDGLPSVATRGGGLGAAPLCDVRNGATGGDDPMPGRKHGNVRNAKQHEGLRGKGMSKERAAEIANSPGASKRGGKKAGAGSSPPQGGPTAPQPAARRDGGPD